MNSDKPQINQQNATVEQQTPAQRPIYIALGYAGLLPFALSLGVILAAAVSGPGVHSAALFGLYAPYVFIAYSACILSFLSGAVWRDNTAEHGAASLLIISNAPRCPGMAVPVGDSGVADVDAVGDCGTDVWIFDVTVGRTDGA